MKIPITHKACGGAAFLYEEGFARPGMPFLSRYAARPDGSPMDAATQIKCHACGKPIGRVGELTPERPS